MFAWIAAVCFALALILHLLDVNKLVEVFTLSGLLAVALHLAFGTGVPWRRT